MSKITLPPLPEPVAYRWYESKWGDYSYSDAPRLYRDNEPIYTAEQLQADREAVIRACAEAVRRAGPTEGPLALVTEGYALAILNLLPPK